MRKEYLLAKTLLIKEVMSINCKTCIFTQYLFNNEKTRNLFNKEFKSQNLKDTFLYKRVDSPDLIIVEFLTTDAEKKFNEKIIQKIEKELKGKK